MLTVALLAALWGTPSTHGEQLPPVAIRSPVDDAQPESEPEPVDEEVFRDRRSTSWQAEASAPVPPNRVPAPPDGAGSDPLVVPATTVPPPSTTLPPVPTVPPSTVPPPVVARPGQVTVATGTSTPASAPAVPSSGGGVPAWPPYTTRPGLTDVAALTGWPAPAEIAAAPVLAVKIDNVGLARPQWQLDRADVVFEENVEGATRFLALFHSDVPGEMGPVRSARTTDLEVLPALNRPVFAWSGGNPGVTEWVASAASSGVLVDVAGVRSNCYRREPTRRAPHNLVASTACLRDRGATGGAGAAVPLWSIDADWTAGALSTSPDTSFEVAMDGGLRAGWTWDPANAVYVRSQNGAPHVVASGATIAAENVVVLTVPHRPSAVDARSPHAETTGTGPAVIHRDGMAIPGSWVRTTTFEPFRFVAADGSEIALQVGRTFVELAR